MASEEHVDVSVRLPPDLEEWLDEQAADRDRSREDVVRELVAAYRSMTESDASGDVLTDGDLDDVVDADDLDGYVDEGDLDEALAAYVESGTFESALDEQREEFTALLEDVRKRVVQVKREADAKAPADHGHEDVEARVDAVESDVASLSETVDEVASDLDAGFENFEDVLEYLTERTDELEEKTGTLARVLVDLRSEVKRLRATEARRAEAEALQLAANREGVRTAKCGECESPVDVSLLSAPECPHCASTFGDVEKRSGLFSSNRLVTGDPPALPESQKAALDDDLAAELAEQAEDAPE
ncbi:ribbon-helix-helix protein, CopG family [Halorubellus sp. JP-L1]|uniref:ribbon-helix-helix protein, CopG family n=1 Tax=Halorubellus sp. JP-L1 TaxID=2715753 RepID=UPI00140A792F|nr:ribbon-helix-helix protein, CopG family [Halorubellus sp. JP-L1]NHN41309.1 ribbon-helix-helix protein, CopG family [Halorubellus sp. JP-L1]